MRKFKLNIMGNLKMILYTLCVGIFAFSVALKSKEAREDYTEYELPPLELGENEYVRYYDMKKKEWVTYTMEDPEVLEKRIIENQNNYKKREKTFDDILMEKIEDKVLEEMDNW